MPPSVRITREDIINTAISLVSQSGENAINARAISTALGCSTQPIFSNFSSMEELHIAVIKAAEDIYSDHLRKAAESGEYPAYKAAGMAYISFAKEHKELFKLLFMRSRTDAEMCSANELFNNMASIVESNTGLNTDDSRLFHLEMWAYVHGIATMYATGFLDLDRELVSKMLTDSYLGLKKQYGKE